MVFSIALLLTAALGASLYWVYCRYRAGDRSRRPLLTQIGVFFGVFVLLTLILGGTALATPGSAAPVAASLTIGNGLAYIGAALAVGLSGIGGGIAVSASATAAIGAISENERAFGRAMIFVAMAEGAALYGLIVAFLIMML
ncbi:MAG: ATP synthase subunit C [Oscillospiraceae bacterium]|nr:ATP synthase subunit C [Oscillospiraceae bacterium]